MKKLILILSVVFSTVFFCSAERPKVSATLTVEIARPKKDCKQGIWFCNPKVDVDVQMIGRTAKANFTDNGNSTMTIAFLSKLPEQATAFFADVDEVLTMPPSISRLFGYRSLQLIPGTYSINYTSSNPFGSVTVKINAQ
ncbi:MAG: hypothetical protein IPK62_09310 [Bacteroidetes bacterium]|nr:hypothetical protein [Bacteroidota bacterium]MBK8145170.1 hypothetical protein [Bacteroidota bacterium]